VIEGRLSQPQFGIVAIGRNEGERLRGCLRSALASAAPVVYVDSGSSDGSVALAREMGAEIVELDMAIPFTAARARNEGFVRLRVLAPGLTYVQFVDGDCELAAGWLELAIEFLESQPTVAAVCGRRREKHPERSVYNLLGDIDLDRPCGEAKACGGDVMVRVDAFQAVNGYRATLIAGEDPELCVRLRAAGWRIWRLDREMTLHDAAMLRFGQWWKRAVRTGYAYALGAHLHGAAPERHCVRETRSAWFWGLAFPALVGGVALGTGPWALALLVLYPLQVLRIAARGSRSARENCWEAVFIVLGKFPEVVGQMKFATHRYLGGKARLIEYK
jgi:GT2 family glycosyltransferase